jgi:membrane protease YdiL (CAAX protease family)
MSSEDLSQKQPAPLPVPMSSGTPDAVRPVEPVPYPVELAAPILVEGEPLAVPTAVPVAEPAPAVPKLPHPNFGWALLWCLGYFLVTQGVAAMVMVGVLLVQAALSTDTKAYLEQLGAKDYLGSSSFANTILAPTILASQVLSWMFALVAIRLVVGRDWTRQLALRLPSLPHVILPLLGLPGLWLLVFALDHFTQPYLPKLVDMEELGRAFGQWPLLFGVLVIGLGPGVGEELMFRGFLGRGLIGHYGVVAGVVLTSLLFGLVHLEPRQVLYAPVLGLAFHFVYLTTRSLWMPMLMHFLVNSAAVVTAGLTQEGKLASEGPKLNFDWDTVHLCYTAAILLLTVAWALYHSRVRVIPAAGEPEAPGPVEYPGVGHPPPGSGRVLVSPGLGWMASGAVAAAVLAFGLAVYLAQAAA